MDTSQGRRPKAKGQRRLLLALMIALLPISAFTAGAESARLARAKDLIADEQWRRAIVELRAAYEDPAEPSRDEAAFWLAHSLYQSGDAGGALQMVIELERRFARSRWVFPARSLKLEIAQRLNRNDMLWSYATPPPPPPAPAPPAVTPAVPAPAPGVTPALPPTPPPAPAPSPVPPGRVRPRRTWVMQTDRGTWDELDLQIQALGSLMRIEPSRAVPILKDVALSATDEDQARRAIFVLVQSNRLDARAAVADIAKQGPEEVTLAAVRELGLIRSPDSARLLRDLYSSGSQPVKVQVLRSLGAARQAQPLMQLARTESERGLRETAVSALGQAGARLQLATLYRQQPDLRMPVITALFTAAGEDELIAIAQTERDPRLRGEAIARLKLLGTPRAKVVVDRLR
jgi:hypothetical protein